MALLPDYPQTGGSVSPMSGIDIDSSIGGEIRARINYDTTIYAVTVVFGIIDSTQKQAIMDFYNLYKSELNTVTSGIDGYSYQGVFENEPAFSRVGPSSFSSTVMMRCKRL